MLKQRQIDEQLWQQYGNYRNYARLARNLDIVEQ